MVPGANKMNRAAQSTTVLDMSATQARKFFLKPESYCNIDLPPYFDFKPLLAGVAKTMSGQPLTATERKEASNYEDVNYTLITNKDGRHAWRPLELIHPALYVSLVNAITEKAKWDSIGKRFKEFQQLERFECLSLPVESRSRRKDKAVQILQWWHGIEQRSIELALDYSYVLHADITDCYGSIYTHSIAWALHKREEVKERKNRNKADWIGNVIDWHIQAMQHGQTNGIPQGSVLMDFIAEMVLGCADLALAERLKTAEISDFFVLRYRDDYRIFVNSPSIGEQVLKSLTEVLIDLGLKLNVGKTTGSQSVVKASLKPDKYAWLQSRQGDRDLQKHLLVIHALGGDFPNAGGLINPLNRYLRRISKARSIRNPLVIASIAIDIAAHSPKVFPICAAIVSVLLSKFKSKKAKLDLIQRIHKKLSHLPNTGHMEVWLQRISLCEQRDRKYGELLCKLVVGEKAQVWNHSWIQSHKLKKALQAERMISKAKLKKIRPVIKPAEVELFSYGS